ncbi:MAG: hypothetical protein Q7V57_14215 [Actinomycetota bacterium]|nr:hypothetical protein [Actinomycetota bacterium]
MNSLRPIALSVVAAFSLAACSDDSSGSSQAATATLGDAFCLAGEQMNASLDALGAAFDTNDPATVEAAMNVVLADGASVSKIAPADIDSQVKSSVDSWNALAVVLEKNGWDIAAATNDPEFPSEEESAALEANGVAIEAYLAEKCGFES